ncbi:MAG TPA: gliding motility-associated C-terminal domain-containing protein [Bacteroidia bacterium]|jgi:gliding motility-associated-like protein|nr:gliding motility-associated C-terminal domain-containing protein [Bacteroidia bacterium]
MGSILPAQTWDWARMGHGNEEGTDVCLYGADNIYYTGYFAHTISFGPNTLNDVVGIDDVFLAKYDSSGNALWARQSQGLNTNSYCEGFGTDADFNGNVFLSGTFKGQESFGTFLLNDSLQTAMFLTKYDPNGNALWAVQSKPLSLNGTASGSDVAGDLSGNAYVVGYYSDSVAFGSIALIDTLAFIQHVYVAKYSATGVSLWAKTVSAASAASIGTAVATDRKGNVFATGYFYGTMRFGAFTLSVPPTSGASMFLVKFDSSGIVLWARQSVPASPVGVYVTPNDLVADATGNIYVTGSFLSGASFGTANLFSNASDDVFLVKYDPSGNLVWAKQSQINWTSWCGYTLATDTSRNVYLSGAGSSLGTDSLVQIEFDTSILSMSGLGVTEPLFIAKFDSLGNYMCGSMIASGGAWGDDNQGLAVEPSGRHAYVVSDINSAVKIGPDSLLNPNTYLGSPFLARWQPCIQSHVPIPLPRPPPDCPQIYIPNTFSPNGDGHNELECVYGGCIKTIDFTIYDRWGEKVFQSTNLNHCWDGMYMGKLMNSAVFAYYMTAVLEDGRVITQKGMINLLR